MSDQKNARTFSRRHFGVHGCGWRGGDGIGWPRGSAAECRLDASGSGILPATARAGYAGIRRAAGVHSSRRCAEGAAFPNESGSSCCTTMCTSIRTSGTAAIWHDCRRTACLYTFRANAGLPVGSAKPLGGWEQPENGQRSSELRGHFGGHFLSASAQLAATGDKRGQSQGRLHGR